MKALNQWARYYGYNDFNTYLRAGGSIAEAADDIGKRIRTLQSARDQLFAVSPRPPHPPAAPTLDLPDVPDADVDKPDPANAHVQGAEGG